MDAELENMSHRNFNPQKAAERFKGERAHAHGEGCLGRQPRRALEGGRWNTHAQCLKPAVEPAPELRRLKYNLL